MSTPQLVWKSSSTEIITSSPNTKEMDCLTLKRGILPWSHLPLARFHILEGLEGQSNISHHSYERNDSVSELSIGDYHLDQDFLNKPAINLFDDWHYWIAATFAFLITRILAERFIFFPVGKHLGIKERFKSSSITQRFPKAVLHLENAYKSIQKKRDLDKVAVSNLVSQTGLTYREIERWFRWRRGADRPSTLTKFSESSWRFTCYVGSSMVGLYALWDKPWALDTDLCLQNTQLHETSSEMRVYFAYGFSVYSHFLLTQAFDVKRKDFLEMFLHHVITLTLMVIAVHSNSVRLGLYILFLHDCADIFLEAAKMANYAKKQDLSTGIFVTFTLVWTISRLIVYPKTVILKLIFYDTAPDLAAYAWHPQTVGLLTALFGLHIFWTYFICKVAISAVTNGTENHKDSRSSSEDSSDSDSEDGEPWRKRDHTSKAVGLDY